MSFMSCIKEIIGNSRKKERITNSKTVGKIQKVTEKISHKVERDFLPEPSTMC